MARTEAKMKLAVLAVVGLALSLGGVSGFASALVSIVFLLFGAGVIGIGCLLLLRSALAQHNKVGGLLMIFGGVVALFWSGLRAPREWPQELARVTSINGPPAETQTEYFYDLGGDRKGTRFKTAQIKNWSRLPDAQKYRAAQTFVYYNPSNLTEVKFEPVGGWVRAQANPGATKVRQTRYMTAGIAVGTGFSAVAATTTGPNVASYSVGSTFQIWRDPVERKELSLEPKKTVGGQRYGLLATSLVLVVGGICTMVFGKSWFDLPTSFARQTSYSAPPIVHAPQPPTIAEQLAAIDWYQFEAVAARIMESEGWSVVRSGGARPDGGADILATRNSQRAVVQCKFWRRFEITPRTIREVIGTKASAAFRADHAFLFTFSDLTVAAENAAKADDVTIYDAARIEAAIRRIGVDRFPELINPNDKNCPRCGAKMVLITRTAKPFWGCSMYGRTRCIGKFECA